jgi:8-oxo-dGTP pyrophosphatase MutT (NUDIX family)
VIESGPTRDFTVAVFVVHQGEVLLHRHRRLGRWLPPGGHIEPNELPDDAALREVEEETGVTARLIGSSGNPVDEPGQPRQLCRPVGVQLAAIEPGHEHIDLVYLAIAAALPAELPPDCGWFPPAAWPKLELTAEVEGWCHIALAELSPGS